MNIKKAKVSISLSVINLHMSNLQCIFGGLYTPINKKKLMLASNQLNIKGWKRYENSNQKRGGLVLPISDKIDFKSKSTRNK